MTRVLLVTVHPLSDSLNAALAAEIVSISETMSAQVTHLDLAATGFDPVLSAAERASTYAPSYDDSRVAPLVVQLQQAELLVLVFPTWWFGLPAQLKGWIDRVWAPGHAYDHASDLGPIRGRLTGLRQVIVVTTLGAPAWVDWLVMRRPVRRVLKWGVVKVCAPQARFCYHALHGAEAVTPARLAQFKAGIARDLRKALR